MPAMPTATIHANGGTFQVTQDGEVSWSVLDLPGTKVIVATTVVATGTTRSGQSAVLVRQVRNGQSGIWAIYTSDKTWPRPVSSRAVGMTSIGFDWKTS